MPNFVKIGQSVAKILRFIDFSRWRPPPSCIFEIVNFCMLLVSAGTRHITVPNFVKIGRSIAEILHFFEFSRWPPPPSWIFEIAKFYQLLWSRVWRRISTPNFVKIGQSVAKILRFFDFSIWRLPPFFKMAAATILDCRICKILLAHSVSRAQTHHCTKFCQNWSFNCGDIAIFRIFKMATAAILNF